MLTINFCQKTIQASCTPQNQLICDNFYRFNSQMLLVNFQTICLGVLGWSIRTVSHLSSMQQAFVVILARLIISNGFKLLFCVFLNCFKSLLRPRVGEAYFGHDIRVNVRHKWKFLTPQSTFTSFSIYNKQLLTTILIENMNYPFVKIHIVCDVCK